MSEPKLEIIDKKIIAIEPKLDRFVDIFEKYLGISIEKYIQGNSNFSLKNKCFPISLADTLEGIEDFEVALETLQENTKYRTTTNIGQKFLKNPEYRTNFQTNRLSEINFS